jgi:hypothetical protein
MEPQRAMISALADALAAGQAAKDSLWHKHVAEALIQLAHVAREGSDEELEDAWADVADRVIPPLQEWTSGVDE